MARPTKYTEKEQAVGKLLGNQTDGLVIGTGPERTGWYYVNGKKQVKITLGQVHRGDMPIGTQRALFKQMHVTPSQFFLLADCQWNFPEYRQNIIQKLALDEND